MFAPLQATCQNGQIIQCLRGNGWFYDIVPSCLRLFRDMAVRGELDTSMQYNYSAVRSTLQAPCMEMDAVAKHVLQLYQNKSWEVGLPMRIHTSFRQELYTTLYVVFY